MLPRSPLVSVLIAVGWLCAAPAQAQKPSLPPATSPEAMTAEVGVFGGLLFVSDRHELYNPRLDWAPIDSPALDIGLRAGFFPVRFLGVEAEGALMPMSIEGGRSGTGYAVRGHLVLQLPNRFTPFAVVGGGALGITSANDALGRNADATFHWGLGAKYYLNDLFSLRLDGRHIVAPSLDEGEEVLDPSITSHFEALLGIGLTFPRQKREDPDPDGDGFRGAADKCPTVAGVAPDGCPPKDTDGDGFLDPDDACPTVAGVAPDGCPAPDRDRDGVPDREDKCPDVPGVASAQGCPDRDGDGVPDADDRCPDRAGVAPHGCPADDVDGDGVIGDADRCPDEPGVAPHGCPDRDGDGVPDFEDQCPDEPETINQYKDDDGCPDEIPAAVRRFTGTIEGIRFGSGSARVVASSFPLLNRAVKVLKDFPEVKMEIDGHTDSTGDRDNNLTLSRERAEAVKAYFVKKGIDEGRLVAKGFGPDQPVETNETAAGRAKNRRIEFKLIQ